MWRGERGSGGEGRARPDQIVLSRGRKMSPCIPVQAGKGDCSCHGTCTAQAVFRIAGKRSVPCLRGRGEVEIVRYTSHRGTTSCFSPPNLSYSRDDHKERTKHKSASLSPPSHHLPNADCICLGMYYICPPGWIDIACACGLLRLPQGRDAEGIRSFV